MKTTSNRPPPYIYLTKNPTNIYQLSAPRKDAKALRDIEPFTVNDLESVEGDACQQFAKALGAFLELALDHLAQ